ncbi:MAG TPA: hypothetical protein VEY12_04705 [Thermoplasmata archaeon]|nr:hypothetical protein [Thermoplasmata archaeon]
MARGRNFPLSGETWKDPEGTFKSDWTSAWLIGVLVLLALLVIVFLISR